MCMAQVYADGIKQVFLHSFCAKLVTRNITNVTHDHQCALEIYMQVAGIIGAHARVALCNDSTLLR
jgi:hypothetical protein